MFAVVGHSFKKSEQLCFTSPENLVEPTRIQTKTPMTKKSVLQKLESWLSRGYGITPAQALDKWGCLRLAARIHNLREAGMSIVTETVNANGKSFARYKLSR